MMNHRLKQILRYLLIPILYMVILYGVYRVAGEPVEAYILSQIRMAAEQGKPMAHTISVDPELREAFEQRGWVGSDEIRLPSVGERYAQVSCDRIRVDAPLYYGDQEEVLQAGLGQYTGSVLPGFGGTVLVGGHDTTWLAGLADVAVGDIFVVDTEYGRYEYTVRETRIVSSTDDAACQLEHPAGQLVLYTCYPFRDVWEEREERFFVYCDQISGPVVKEAGE